MYQELEMSQENPTKAAGACMYELYCTVSYFAVCESRFRYGYQVHSIYQ